VTDFARDRLPCKEPDATVSKTSNSPGWNAGAGKKEAGLTHDAHSKGTAGEAAVRPTISTFKLRNPAPLGRTQDRQRKHGIAVPIPVP
jgi:hypothetical protein